MIEHQLFNAFVKNDDIKRLNFVQMTGRLTKLLLLFSIFPQLAYSQCALITDNYSGQSPNSVCAPVNLVMDTRYKFIVPVNPSRVEILYVWNDGLGSTTLVPAISQGDTIFSASESHVYPPAGNCSYTAEAYIVFDNNVCASSSRQEQTFSAWARDNENGGVIITEPVVAQFCEGEDIVDVTFDDNSTFNCNIGMEPDKPNRLSRWVQFIYGTQSIGGDRIPDITVRDPLGNIYPMTDAAGNSSASVSGPIIEIPVPADGPDQTSWSISAPAGGIAGDIFEITLRNWNMCNPYDRNPFDSIQPTDLINGDYDPITTTALIEIITTPPVITNPSLEFCVDNPIILTLSTSGGTVNWYSDSALTNHIHTGNSFNPVGPPTFIDNSTGGNYTYYVTENIGACASEPGHVSFEIFDSPSPPADAGDNRSICADTITLEGNSPVIGTGVWTTTGNAIIDDPINPRSFVRNLDAGPNLFRWTLSHGPCTSIAEVTIIRDRQPAPANAGPNQSFCDISNVGLLANYPTNSGIGTWSIESGNAVFSDIHNAHATLSAIAGGENFFVWTIVSQYGACTTSYDTLRILRDVSPDPANAGPDRLICEYDTFRLEGNEVTNNGTGTWSVITGTSIISDVNHHTPLASNLNYGINRYRWDITSRFNLCPASTNDVTITRDEAPDAAMAGMDQFLCNSVSSPLGANIPSIGNGVWSVVTNPSGINPVFNPSANNPNATVQILPGNEGLYRFMWRIVNGSCVTSDTVVIDFGIPVQPADAGNDDTICGLSYILSANDAGVGTGTWTRVTGPGSVNFLPDIHAPNATAILNSGDEGIYTFQWRITSGSCPPSSDTVQILFKRSPGLPDADDAENCGPGSVILQATIGLNGSYNRWYDQNTGGNLLIENKDYTTPYLTASQTYWVASIDSVTNCESARRRIDVLIHTIPGQPVSSDHENCGPASVTFIATIGTNGNTNRWYAVSSGGTVLSESQNYTTGLISSTQSYWVSSYNTVTRCESSRIEVRSIIYPIPGQPDADDVQRCGDGSLILNSLSGTNGTINRWYDNAAGGPVIDSGLVHTTPYLTATRNYYISSFNDTTGCESPRRLVRAIINPIPDFPVVNNLSGCGPDTLIFTSIPGLNASTSHWYDSITGGNLLARGITFNAGYLSSTSRFFVSGYNDSTNCESSRIPVEGIILPEPAANPIIGVSEVGLGQTNVIYSVNYHPGSTYNWDIPAGVNLLLENQYFVILEFTNLGLFTISVTETNSLGCQGPEAFKSILVREDLLYINLNITQGNVCVSEDLQLSAIPSGGTPSYSFDWSGDSYLLSSSDISNPVFRANTPGNYHLYLSVMDINLNEIKDTVDITVYPNPVTSVSVPDTIVCAGENMLISTQTYGGSGIFSSYNWTGQTAPLSSVNVQSPVFNTLIEGYFDLIFTVEDSRGCKAVDSVTIFNDSPRSSFISDVSPQCSPVTFHFINTSEDAVSYSWDFGDGDSSLNKDAIHEFFNVTSSISYYDVVLTAISENGCRHTSNEYVTVYPNPEIEIVVSPKEACHPADVFLSSDPGGYSYSWDFGDGSNETGGYNTIHQFLNTGNNDTVYPITLISTSFFNCYDTGYSEVTVYPTPEATFVATPLTQMYPERSVTITNTTPGEDWEYIWSYGDHMISYEKDPVSHIYPEEGNYILTLTVKGEHCSDSSNVQIEILPHPPVAQFKPVEPGCVPLTIQFENTSTFSTSFLWEFGDGAISNKPNPQYTYYEPGVYKIKLTATGPGGSDAHSTINSAYILPNAFFDLAPRYVYVNDEPVHFFNLSDNGYTYEWDFGDGSTSGEFNPVHMYRQEGTYNVTLNVWTEYGCQDLFTMESAALVQPSGKLIFPNAFRPESPIEENRVFKPAVLDQVDEYHLMIFNRWGELIFESFDRETGWDGTITGVNAKQDVYVWKVEGKYTNGQGFTDTGDVTLLR